MGEMRLSSPRIIVRRDGHEDLEIQTTNADLVLWDRTRAKHKWPKFDEAPFLWLTFLSWAAARRTGAIEPGFQYEKWEAETLDVEALADEDDETGDPIPRVPEPD